MPSQEVKDALMEKRVDFLEKQVQRLAEERDTFLRWGILTLGAALVGLLVWIFTFVTTTAGGR